MVRKFVATIYYTIKPNHPDVNCTEAIPNETEMEFTDEYSFDTKYDRWENTEECKEYIQQDLITIASGGYENRDGIYIDVLNFEIRERRDDDV